MLLMVQAKTGICTPLHCLRRPWASLEARSSTAAALVLVPMPLITRAALEHFAAVGVWAHVLLAFTSLLDPASFLQLVKGPAAIKSALSVL